MFDKLYKWCKNLKQNSAESTINEDIEVIIKSIEDVKTERSISDIIDSISKNKLNCLRTNLLPNLLENKKTINEAEKKAKYDLVIFYVELSLLIPTMKLFVKEKNALEKIQKHLRIQEIDYFKAENIANKEVISYQLWKFYRVFQFKEFLLKNHERIASEVNIISTQTNKLIEMIDKAFLWNIANESDDNKHKYVQKFYTKAVLEKEVEGAYFKKELNLEAQEVIKKSMRDKYNQTLPNKSDFLEDWFKNKFLFLETTEDNEYYINFDNKKFTSHIDIAGFKQIIEKLAKNTTDKNTELTNSDFKKIELFVLCQGKTFNDVLLLSEKSEKEINKFFKKWTEHKEQYLTVERQIKKGLQRISKKPRVCSYKLTEYLLYSQFDNNDFKCHLHSIWDGDYYPKMQKLINKNKILIKDILQYSNTLQEGKKTISHLAHSTGFGIHMDHTVERDVLKRYFEGVCLQISERKNEQDKILEINKNIDPILPYMFGCLTLNEQNKGKSSNDSISTKIKKAQTEINKYQENCIHLFYKYFNERIEIFEIPNYGKWSDEYNEFAEWINSREIKKDMTNDHVNKLLPDYDIDNIKFNKYSP